MSNVAKIKLNVPTRFYSAETWLPRICEELKKGLALYEACSLFPDGPAPDTVLGWVKKDPEGAGRLYADAREVGYLVLGDRISEIASETHAYTYVPLLDAEGKQICDEEGNPRTQRVLVPLSSDVIAHKRLQIDTLKWKLSKMLPKVYGEKITQEHVGAGGGPIAFAATQLKSLSDEELETLQRVLAKAEKAALPEDRAGG